MPSHHSLIKVNRASAAAFALSVLGIGGFTSAALADVLSYRVYQQSFDPSKPSDSDVKQAGALPGGLSTDITKAWNTYVSQATPFFVQSLSKADGVKPGYTLYNVRLNLGSIDQIQLVQRDPSGANSIPPVDANDPMIIVTSTQARLDANSTTPFTSHSQDPSFHLTFDVTVQIHLTLGPRASEVKVSGAVVNLSNSQYFADNASANEGQILDALGSTVGIQSTQDKIRASVDSASIKITTYLRGAIRQANQQLDNLVAQQSMATQQNLVVAGIFSDSAGLSFVVAPVLTPNSNGQMRGTLTVVDQTAGKSAQGGALDCSNLFVIHDRVQVQPRYVATLNPTTFLNADPTTQAIDSQIAPSFGGSSPTTSGWTCDFIINGLAQNFSNQISFSAANAAGSPAAALGRSLSVDFKTCSGAPRGPSASYRTGSSSDFCASQLRTCSSPLAVPAGANPSCDLLAKLETKGSNVGAAMRRNAQLPLVNGGDPAAANTSAAATSLPQAGARDGIQWGSAAQSQWGAKGTGQSSLGHANSAAAANASGLQKIARPATQTTMTPAANAPAVAPAKMQSSVQQAQ